jgi:hypothetical protein
MRNFLDDYWNTPEPQRRNPPPRLSAWLTVCTECVGYLGLAVAILACLAIVRDTL